MSGGGVSGGGVSGEGVSGEGVSGGDVSGEDVYVTVTFLSVTDTYVCAYVHVHGPNPSPPVFLDTGRSHTTSTEPHVVAEAMQQAQGLTLRGTEHL